MSTAAPNTLTHLDEELDGSLFCEYLPGCPDAAIWLLRHGCCRDTTLFCRVHMFQLRILAAGCSAVECGRCSYMASRFELNELWTWEAV